MSMPFHFNTLPLICCDHTNFLGLDSKFPDASFMASLRNGVKGLLAQQYSRLPHQLGSMSLSTPSSPSSHSTEPGSPVSDRRPRNRRSYERARPSHTSPHSPLSPASGNFSDVPPSAPDAPGSPFTSSATSHSLGSNIVSDHWEKNVFKDARATTRIPYVGER